MTRSDVTLCSWNSPALLAGNTEFYRSRSVFAKQSSWLLFGEHRSGVLQNLWTDAGTCVHCTNTCLRHQPLWPATWSSASLTHGQAYHNTSSTKRWSMEKAVTCKHEGKRTLHWTSAKLKAALFRANTLPTLVGPGCHTEVIRRLFMLRDVTTLDESQRWLEHR